MVRRQTITNRSLYDSLKQLAMQLSGPAGPMDAGGPVSVLDCLARAEHRDVVVLEASMHASMRGGVQAQYGRWVILVNERDGRREARFTLAHEAGHILLGDVMESTGLSCGAEVGPRDREALCDAFAAELLLPSGAVRRAWRRLQHGGRRGGDQTGVAAMADRFDVTGAAVRDRLLSLGLIPG